MQFRLFDNCCGAIIGVGVSTPTEQFLKDYRDYLHQKWMPEYYLHPYLPQMLILIAYNGHEAEKRYLDLGFQKQPFWGIHPGAVPEPNLSLLTYNGDPQKFLGPIYRHEMNYDEPKSRLLPTTELYKDPVDAQGKLVGE